MEEVIVKGREALRYGYTTGSCATAAAKAAAEMLLTQKSIDIIRLMTPKGFLLHLEVFDIVMTEEWVRCAIIKDAGDDPDVTHGIKIYATVKKLSLENEDIIIEGGQGVGRVTKPGLKVPVGEAAINPGPRGTIFQEVKSVSEKYHYEGALSVLIEVPEGEKIATKTFNPRLGIEKGISILGTTGIVEPMSEAALIETIHVEMNMLKANGYKTLLVCPGNYGRDFIEQHLNISSPHILKCSNFIGEMLDYAVYLGFESIMLVGHMGKLVKLAAGIMNTHSKYADGRIEIICSHAALNGASKEVVKRLWEGVTTDEAVTILKQEGMDRVVLQSIMKKVQEHLNYRVKNQLPIQVLMFSDVHGLLGTFEERVHDVDRKVKEEYQ